MDWIEWERAGEAPVSGEGNGFGARYREGFALYASLGLRHHRLSIEWARIEAWAMTEARGVAGGGRRERHDRVADLARADAVLAELLVSPT